MIGTNRNPEGGVHDIPPQNSRFSGNQAKTEAEFASEQPKHCLRILTLSDVLNQPALEWLIEDLLARDTDAVLFAAPGAGKTFLALDMGVSIASGTPWFGRKVHAGPVVYLAAEGIRGLRKRLAARLGLRLRDRDDVIFKRLHIIPQAVNFLEPRAFESLLAAIKSLPEKPVLIVIDTLARCMVGGDENSAQHMGMFVDGCDRLRAETGATILVVHHPVKHGDGERGSSTLGGAADTKLEITLEGDVRVLSCRKQKDAEGFEPLYFRLVPVQVEVGEDGGIVTSCRVSPATEPPPQQSEGSEKEDPDTVICRTLREQFPTEGATGPELIKATGLKGPTFYRHLTKLETAGEVEEVPGSKPTRYRLATGSHQSHSHSPGVSGGNETESGHSQSQSLAPVGGETESEAETGPEEDLFGGEGEEDYHP